MPGLRSCIYRVPELDSAREWYSRVFKTEPYFVEEYYVGFNIGGYELGLLPDATPREINLSGISYWDTSEIGKSLKEFTEAGAKIVEDVQDVGDGVKLAAVSDPWNNAVVLIENRFLALVRQMNCLHLPGNPALLHWEVCFLKVTILIH
jgi:predicted enzyme related to lactoylglutathione lyase